MSDTPPLGQWRRYPTVTHPKKRNGAAKFCGTHGFAQEHSTMQEVAVWKSAENTDAPAIDHAALKAATQREQQRIALGRARAAEKAQAIVAQSKPATHAYLESKGFPETLGLVWQREGAPVLVVPMRVDGKLVGCQLIDEAGDKKFLLGQLTRGATFVIGQGEPVFCEGYATALSANKALQASRLRGRVVVCFSAHNLQMLATSGVVLADNDESKTGERAALATGRPYFMSPVMGEDFNDFTSRVGLFAASQELKASLAKARRMREAPACNLEGK